MALNADFSQRVCVDSERLDWLASPMPGVERRMLDRVGGEVARATSIVRYAPGSRFSAHRHGGGEEFLVLDGVFQDEHGDYPEGSYLRNPPTSSHEPGSESGCEIFVKLHQFDPADRVAVRLRLGDLEPTADSSLPGLETCLLHHDDRESVSIESVAPDLEWEIDTHGGAEILVLEGGFEQAGDALSRRSWLRLPDGISARARAGAAGARFWIKRGHLRFAEEEIARLP